MNAQYDLTGEVAVVTGASRGIGAEIADRLADAGARVIGTGTSEEGARRISERLARHPGSRGVVLDVSQHAQVAAVQADIEVRDGPVTLLINNAGITRDNLLLRMKDAEWDQVIATDLSGVFYVTKTFLRGMIRARRGRIISIASVVGSIGNAGQSNYAAAKAGVVGFSKSLAREVGSRGITVNVVAPGFIATEMTDSLTGVQRDNLLGQIPLQRLGGSSDVAHAVLFLASPSAAYITGETLHVNGGLYMA